jgi:hypothetical protein
MNTEMWIASTEMYVTRGIHPEPASPKNNLGAAIVQTAINDYRNPTPGVHEHAREFLYPRSKEAREHFAWVLALAPGVDPRWLREMLDKRRPRWDAQRWKAQRGCAR